MLRKKIGIGTASLLLDLFGLAWCVSYNTFCLGDTILNRIGLIAWSNGNGGSHLAIIYSLIFLFPH